MVTVTCRLTSSSELPSPRYTRANVGRVPWRCQTWGGAAFLFLSFGRSSTALGTYQGTASTPPARAGANAELSSPLAGEAAAPLPICPRIPPIMPCIIPGAPRGSDGASAAFAIAPPPDMPPRTPPVGSRLFSVDDAPAPSAWAVAASKALGWVVFKVTEALRWSDPQPNWLRRASADASEKVSVATGLRPQP